MTSTAFDLSAADFAAIEFYEQHADAVKNWGILSTFGDDRADRMTFRRGERFVADAIASASRSSATVTSRLSICSPSTAPAVATARPVSPNSRKRFPRSGHSPASVDMKVCRFRVRPCIPRRQRVGDRQAGPPHQRRILCLILPDLLQ